MKELRLDWRNVPDLTKSAALYSVSANHESRPVTGNPQGRILVGISPTILYTDQCVVSPRKYNNALALEATRLGAMTKRVVWPFDPMTNRPVAFDAPVYKTVLFDLTKRGMLKAWLEILDAHFPWADGFHIDYFSAWSWLFPDMAESDAQWDNLLTALGNALRRKGKLVLGQQFHLTNPLLATNGAFVEQSPYSFRYTLAEHADEMATWRSMINRAWGVTENIWTYEIREWQTWPKASLDLVKTWAEEQDVYLCCGRDGNVMP